MFCFLLSRDLCKCVCIIFIVNNIHVPPFGTSKQRGLLLSARAVTGLNSPTLRVKILRARRVAIVGIKQVWSSRCHLQNYLTLLNLKPNEEPTDCLRKRGWVQEATDLAENLQGTRKVPQTLGHRCSPDGRKGANCRQCLLRE